MKGMFSFNQRAFPVLGQTAAWGDDDFLAHLDRFGLKSPEGVVMHGLPLIGWWKILRKVQLRREKHSFHSKSNFLTLSAITLTLPEP
jgi:hypothetical protein